jgi:hypothetical protein
LVFIGVSLLGYPEREVLHHFTLRKLLALFTEYQKYHGEYKPPVTIDDVIPV